MRAHRSFFVVAALVIGLPVVAIGSAAAADQGLQGSTSVGNPISTCANECAAFQRTCQDPIAQETFVKTDGLEYSIVDLATYGPDQGTLRWSSTALAVFGGFLTPRIGSIDCSHHGAFVLFDDGSIGVPETARWMYVTASAPVTWTLSPGNSGG